MGTEVRKLPEKAMVLQERVGQTTLSFLFKVTGFETYQYNDGVGDLTLFHKAGTVKINKHLQTSPDTVMMM
ncbi:E3 Ubiquitin-Protein Ligase Trim62 [Manis pentadactyla]|nr:E3 Ubiquitin-Protein Ligase Trim62 [Manis pentadactyla]